MPEYHYTGPVSGVPLRHADGHTEDTLLHPGTTVTLPADHPYVETMVARGHLVPLPAPSHPDEET